MAQLLVVDTETGGTDPQTHSILSLAGVVWRDGVLGPDIEIKIVEPVLSVTARAMEINKIDLAAHCKDAVSPDRAVESFQAFLRTHLNAEINSRDRVTLVGHNIGFDVGFMKRLWRFAGSDFDAAFSHRVLDTAGIVRYLALTGTLPLAGASSNEAFAHFGISVSEVDRHTALGDARATAALLTQLVASNRLPPNRRGIAA